MCARGDVAGSTGDLPATGLAQKTTDQQFRGNLGRGLGWGAHTAQPREDGVDKSPGRVLAVPVAQFLQQQQQKGTKTEETKTVTNYKHIKRHSSQMSYSNFF